MVPVLLWGSGGWRCVRQPCRRSREIAMALPLASSAEAIAFGGFKRRVTSWCVARVTFCDILMWHVREGTGKKNERNLQKCKPKPQLQNSRPKKFRWCIFFEAKPENFRPLLDVLPYKCWFFSRTTSPQSIYLCWGKFRAGFNSKKPLYNEARRAECMKMHETYKLETRALVPSNHFYEYCCWCTFTWSNVQYMFYANPVSGPILRQTLARVRPRLNHSRQTSSTVPSHSKPLKPN